MQKEKRRKPKTRNHMFKDSRLDILKVAHTFLLLLERMSGSDKAAVTRLLYHLKLRPFKRAKGTLIEGRH